ncbi:MAG: transposase, partial [Planctomycetes bacterium]|nr:transposase [Planctomycetota bacterium]
MSPYWAGQFLDRWCTRAMRSQIGPMKRVARMLRRHRELILNWFHAHGTVSSGSVEGLQLLTLTSLIPEAVCLSRTGWAGVNPA